MAISVVSDVDGPLLGALVLESMQQYLAIRFSNGSCT